MRYSATLRVKKVFLNIALVVVSFIISLVFIEGITRIAFPIYDPSGHDAVAFYYNHDGTPLGLPNFKGMQWKNTGDYYVPLEINAYGFRDYKDLKQSTSKDIFVVGDSFSFGHGVAEGNRFSDLLQKLINIPIFNISIPGDLSDYCLLVNHAKKNGANIKRLIVGICMENDLLNYETKKPNHWLNYKLDFRLVKTILKQNLATYNMLTTLIHNNYILNKLAVLLGLIDDTILENVHINNRDILNTCFCELNKIINGTEAVILIIPSRSLWVGKHIENERKVHDDFVAILKGANLPVVDMRPILEASGNPLQYHFRVDGHWNELGHAEAAKALANHFQPNKSD